MRDQRASASRCRGRCCRPTTIDQRLVRARSGVWRRAANASLVHRSRQRNRGPLFGFASSKESAKPYTTNEFQPEEKKMLSRYSALSELTRFGPQPDGGAAQDCQWNHHRAGSVKAEKDRTPRDERRCAGDAADCSGRPGLYSLARCRHQGDLIESIRAGTSSTAR